MKIYSLSGFAKVTPNLFVYETERDLIIVDCGIGFPEDERNGNELLVPDVSFLQSKINKIRAIIISHGHDDHLGGLPYVLPKLGLNIPIYAPKWAAALAQNKLKEARLNIHIREFNNTTKLNLGDFNFEFIQVTHSIPDTYHLVIKTPVGIFYHAADFKLDLIPVTGLPTDQPKIQAVGRQGVVCLLSDCLRSEVPGFTPPEAKIAEMFENEIKSCAGKYLVTAISSNIARFKLAIEVAQKHGRKVAVVGRSIRQSVEIGQQLGYLNFPESLFIKLDQLPDYASNQIMILVAGSQAQVGSSLERIVNNQYREIQLHPSDKVIFSTDYIPGNETAIYKLIDNICRSGAEVVYADIHSNVHVSGHGAQKDLGKLIKMVKPKYLLPIGGEYRHLVAYRKLAESLGYQRQSVILADNGNVIDFSPNQPPRIVDNISTKLLKVSQPAFNDLPR